jgi:hypothetical protein
MNFDYWGTMWLNLGLVIVLSLIAFLIVRLTKK